VYYDVKGKCTESQPGKRGIRSLSQRCSCNLCERIGILVCITASKRRKWDGRNGRFTLLVLLVVLCSLAKKKTR